MKSENLKEEVEELREEVEMLKQINNVLESEISKFKGVIKFLNEIVSNEISNGEGKLINEEMLGIE